MGKQKIGFIGVGIMGSHMAGHLINASYTVTAFDINAAALDAVAAKGATRAASSAEAAAGANVVITMVPRLAARRSRGTGSRWHHRGGERGDGLHRHEHHRPGHLYPRCRGTGKAGRALS